jgi:hypothetical protein
MENISSLPGIGFIDGDEAPFTRIPLELFRRAFAPGVASVEDEGEADLAIKLWALCEVERIDASSSA